MDVTFDYKQRGGKEYKQITFEQIDPEFYTDGKKLLRVYSSLKDIAEQYQSRHAMSQIDLLKSEGYPADADFIKNLDKNIPNQQERKEINLKLAIVPFHAQDMTYDMYVYLADNFLPGVYGHHGIDDWYNPTIPFAKITMAIYDTLEGFFNPGSRVLKQNISNGSNEEMQSMPTEQTNQLNPSDSNQMKSEKSTSDNLNNTNYGEQSYFDPVADMNQ